MCRNVNGSAQKPYSRAGLSTSKRCCAFRTNPDLMFLVYHFYLRTNIFVGNCNGSTITISDNLQNFKMPDTSGNIQSGCYGISCNYHLAIIFIFVVSID